MAEQLNPKSVVINGRTVVNRDWISQETGAGLSTVKRWYAKRAEQPEETRHPEKVAKIDRIDYYDLEEFRRFYAWHVERKKEAVLPTSPELYTGRPDDRISINEAARLFNFADTATIRKYLNDFPDYFPKPVGHVTTPSGRLVPAFRRSDLQKFDESRTGSTPVGAGSGRPARPARSVEWSPEVRYRIAKARESMEEAGGWYRGVATALAERHGELGSVHRWREAVREARMELEGRTEQP